MRRDANTIYVAYSRSKDLTERYVADKILAEKALKRKRIIAKNLTLGKRAAWRAVWAAMKAKTKIGMAIKTKKKNRILRWQNVVVSYLFYRCWKFLAR